MNTSKVLLSLFLLSAAAPAFAYLDPGSGSAIMSVIIGSVVALSLMIKTYWYKLKSMVSRSKPTNEEDLTSTSESDK
ncbi:MAG: hypothetical protein ACI93R_001721 [Flavobacteriales bacterium]|jgi:hypothetical protein